MLTAEPDAFERAVDMIRKLRDAGGGNGYTATGLALVGWDEPAGPDGRVRVELDRVPEDVAPAQFLTTVIGHVLAVTPIAHHVDVRSKYERRAIPVPEDDQQPERTELAGQADSMDDSLFGGSPTDS